MGNDDDGEVFLKLMDQLLPGTDLDLVRVVQKHLKAGGADIHLKSKAVKLEKSGGKAAFSYKHTKAGKAARDQKRAKEKRDRDVRGKGPRKK